MLDKIIENFSCTELEYKEMLENLSCMELGYKEHKAGKRIPAYNINCMDDGYEVVIYEMAKCSRCGVIFSNGIVGTYRYKGYYTQADIEMIYKKLHDNGIVSTTESYKML